MTHKCNCVCVQYHCSLNGCLLTVSCHSRFSVMCRFVTGTKGSTILYEFETIDYDIDFRVEFAVSAAAPRSVVVCTDRKQPSKQHHGSLICESDGGYYFVFDNSYSMFRSKTVRYRILVESAADINRVASVSLP